MSSPAPCFASLSRVELAHVARCQRAALERRLSVVSSGVFAAEAGPELAGLHFWLVSSPAAPASVQLVWLSGGRLLCGCKRRRSDGALTCAHAQCVRLFLLAAAGVRLPSSVPAGVSAPATPAPVAPVADPAPDLAECPCCGQDAPRDVLITFGMCADCLDLTAQAERQPRASRCSMFDCNELAIGETVDGVFCARHLARNQLAHAEIEERRRLDEEADRVNWTIVEGEGDEEARCPRCGGVRWHADTLCPNCLNDAAGVNGLAAQKAYQQWSGEDDEEEARAALRDDEALAEAIAAD